MMDYSVGLDTILSEVGSVVTSGIDWAGDVVTFVGNNPLILVFVALPLVGLGIGLVKRMISL